MPGSITFPDRGEPSYIDYNVSLPSSHTGRRIIAMDFGLKSANWTTEALTAGHDPEPHQESMEEYEKRVGILAATSRGKSSSATPGPGLESKIAEASARGNNILPALTWDGRVVPVEVAPQIKPEPRLLVVEVYGISSFLGKYGMGRTVNTFTLLPGEETRITLKTWRSTKENREEASSVVDSHSETASSKFAESMQTETTEKKTESSKEAWEVEASATASWGLNEVNVSAGASGEYQSGREAFARSASEATREHCAEASQKRETSVTSTSSTAVETGEETTTERIIKNINMRRTLNFVFRELNQEYITKLHLKDIRIAFTNGRTGSYREVPLSGMRKLLTGMLKKDKVDDAAKRILKNIAVVLDRQDVPRMILERVIMKNDLHTCKIEEAKMSGGEYPPPDNLCFYRFKKGPIGQSDGHQVDGVVMKEDVIVMRTDGVCVEALVGESDALDDYAMEVQKAAAKARTLANRREKLAQETLAAIEDPRERAEAFARMFVPEKTDG